MTRLSELGKRQAVVPASPSDDEGLDFASAEGDGAKVAQKAAAMVPRLRGDDGLGSSDPAVRWLEVEAVVGGCLMRLHLEGIRPEGVLSWLKGIDPGVKVRDDFPRGGAGGFGKRDTKRARLMVITLKASDNGLFIDLVAQGESDVSVKVSKKKAPEFVGLLSATGRVSEEKLEKLEGAVSAKGQATVILGDDEWVEVEYWTGDDGAAFLEALHAGGAV